MGGPTAHTDVHSCSAPTSLSTCYRAAVAASAVLAVLCLLAGGLDDAVGQFAVRGTRVQNSTEVQVLKRRGGQHTDNSISTFASSELQKQSSSHSTVFSKPDVLLLQPTQHVELSTVHAWLQGSSEEATGMLQGSSYVGYRESGQNDRNDLQHPQRHLRVVEEGPLEGSYTLIADADSFVNTITSSVSFKRLRLRPDSVMMPCMAMRIPVDTAAVVDCRGSTLDLSCSASFVLDVNSTVSLYDCHMMWSPVSDFFNIASETDTLRIEDGARLEQRVGSSTLNCDALGDDEKMELLQDTGPLAGEVHKVTNWETIMRTTTGELLLSDVRLFCSGPTRVRDTTIQEFAAALDIAATQPNTVIPISGLLRLNRPEDWNKRHSVVLGDAVLQGVTPFSAIDFRRASEIFALKSLPNQLQAPMLKLRNLHLINLPQTLTAKTHEEMPGGVSPKTLSGLLWIAKPLGRTKVAASASKAPVGMHYELENVISSVSCTELAFLRLFYERVRGNLAQRSSNGDMDTEHDSIVIEIMEDESDKVLRFSRLHAFGITARDYTISCECMPRMQPLSTNLDEHIAQADAVALADALLPPNGGLEGDSDGGLGSHGEWKLAAICVGVAIISIAAALCYWRGRDLPVEETFRGSMYSYDVGTGSRKRLREYRIHSVRGKEPLELEAFSDRLAVTSAKAVSSGARSSSYDPVQTQHLVSAQISDPEVSPGCSSPPVPGASMLSGSSLDLGKFVDPFRDLAALEHQNESVSTFGGSSIQNSTIRTHSTEAGVPSEISATSVICAGGDADSPTSPTNGPHTPDLPPPPHALTQEERAAKCLQECKQDILDEHLEVEGVVECGPGGGGLLWGSWRGLEVSIKSLVFKVPHECVHVARECMKTEAESAYNLSHANIVNALSHDMKKHSPSSDVQKHTKLTLYMIQEYCAGGSLAELVRQGYLHSSPCAANGIMLENILTILRDAAAGVACMHSQNLVHGDLKPENILLQVPPSERLEATQQSQNACNSWPDATVASSFAATALTSRQCTAKVSNFALASLLSISGVSLAGEDASGGVHLSHYSAPELTSACMTQTTATDVFAFGVIMWELIVPNAAEICRKHSKDQNTSESQTDAKTSQNEFQATPEVAASTFPDSCPFNYAVLALACMSQKPEDRPPMFQIQEVLRSVDVEVGSGRHYMDWTGSHRDVSALGIENVLPLLRTPRFHSEPGSTPGWSGSFRGSFRGDSGHRSSTDSSSEQTSALDTWLTDKSVESVSFYTSVDAASGSRKS